MATALSIVLMCCFRLAPTADPSDSFCSGWARVAGESAGLNGVKTRKTGVRSLLSRELDVECFALGT